MRHDRVVHVDCSQLWLPAILVLVMGRPSSTADAPDTKGREFLITAFDVEPGSRVTLEIIPQVSEVAHISLTTPQSSPPLDQSFVTESRKSTFVTLPSEVLLRAEGISNYGVLVTSSADVSIIVMYGNQSDSCLILPRDVLGTDYTVLLGDAHPQGVFMLAIGAAFTNVTVNISASAGLISGQSVGNYLADGCTLQLQLAAFQTFFLKGSENLSGLTVTSDQPVAVWAGHLLQSAQASGFVSEMVLPANTWGRKFVLVPPSTHANFSLKILARSNCTLTVHSADDVTTCELLSMTPMTLSFYGEPFVYLHSSNSTLVLQTSLSTLPDSPGQSQMFYVPPVEQYLTHYSFALRDCSRICLRAINPSQGSEGFLLDGQKMSALTNLLSFFVEQKSYTIMAADSIASGFHDLDHTLPTRSFCAYVSYESEYGFRPLGMRMANLYDACTPIQALNGGLGDGIDNDCDGFVDEELFNGVDDDDDGLVDEDTAEKGFQLSVFGSTGSNVLTGSDAPTVDNNLIAVIVSLTVAIGAILILIGSCLLHDFLKRRRGIRSTRITPFVS